MLKRETPFQKIAFPLLLGILLMIAFSNRITHPVTAATYNRANAVSYADQWAKARNSTYPNFDPNDCTNFASQVMSAGGLPMISLQSEARDWFINTSSSNVRSKSWAAADWLNTHFSQWQGGRYQTTNAASNLQGGDIMILQWSNSPVPSHARVMMGYGPSLERIYDTTPPIGTYGTLANQHSNDRKRVLWYDGISSTDLRWYWQIIL